MSSGAATQATRETRLVRFWAVIAFESLVTVVSFRLGDSSPSVEPTSAEPAADGKQARLVRFWAVDLFELIVAIVSCIFCEAVLQTKATPQQLAEDASQVKLVRFWAVDLYLFIASVLSCIFCAEQTETTSDEQKPAEQPAEQVKLVRFWAVDLYLSIANQIIDLAEQAAAALPALDQEKKARPPTPEAVLRSPTFWLCAVACLQLGLHTYAGYQGSLEEASLCNIEDGDAAELLVEGSAYAAASATTVVQEPIVKSVMPLHRVPQDAQIVKGAAPLRRMGQLVASDSEIQEVSLRAETVEEEIGSALQQLCLDPARKDYQTCSGVARFSEDEVHSFYLELSATLQPHKSYEAATLVPR